MKQTLTSTPLHAPTSAIPGFDALDFALPPELEASAPPEAHGLTRDAVRLMVSYRADNRVVHTHFSRIGDFLHEGDLLVINTSGTMNAALNATRADDTPLELHISTALPAGLWVVEVRTQNIQTKITHPFYDAKEGETLQLAAGATATLHASYQPYPYQEVPATTSTSKSRLWIATLHLPYTLQVYLAQHGFPIRYGYVQQRWPIDYYQTVYTTEIGSAEMPSAGRAFTPELITQLVARGIQIAPLLLHTGVASLETHDPPYEEYYRVSSTTAQLVNTARSAGQRVIAVGTTVVRALETVTDMYGTTHPGEGWTRAFITPERGIRALNGLLTGLHEPRATHLLMLETLASREHLAIAYREALHKGYLWHEFGDLHLILP